MKLRSPWVPETLKFGVHSMLAAWMRLISFVGREWWLSFFLKAWKDILSHCQRCKYSLLASSNSLSRSLIDIINVRQAFVQIYLTGDQMLKLTSFRNKENTKRNQQSLPTKEIIVQPTSELPPVPASAVAEVCTGEFLPDSSMRRSHIWFGNKGN